MRSRTLASLGTGSFKANAAARQLGHKAGHALVTTKSAEQFAEEMKAMMAFIDHGAQPESFIMGASNPILPPAQCVIDAMVAAATGTADVYTWTGASHQEAGNTMRYYGSRRSQGVTPLRDVLSGYCERMGFTLGEDGDPNQLDFFVTTSIQSVLLSRFVDHHMEKGDKVLMTTPMFGPFFNMMHRRGMDCQLYRLSAESDWKLTPEILTAMLEESPDAKNLFFFNPGNPMGESYSREEIQALADVILAHNEGRKARGEAPLMVISDEVARNIMLDKDIATTTSIGSIPGMEEYTYTLWSLSKDQGPGLGVAIGVGPKHLIEQIRDNDLGVAYPMQMAAAATFSPDYQAMCRAHYDKQVAIYRENTALVERMAKETSVPLPSHSASGSSEVHTPAMYLEAIPQGGFQVVLNAYALLGARLPDDYELPTTREQRLVTSSMDLAWYLRDRAKVEMMPGEGFGFDGEQMMVRMTISKRYERLQEMFGSLQPALSALTANPAQIQAIEEERAKQHQTVNHQDKRRPAEMMAPALAGSGEEEVRVAFKKAKSIPEHLAEHYAPGWVSMMSPAAETEQDASLRGTQGFDEAGEKGWVRMLKVDSQGSTMEPQTPARLTPSSLASGSMLDLVGAGDTPSSPRTTMADLARSARGAAYLPGR